MLEVWCAGGAQTGLTPEAARAVEEDGWDGQAFMDSQCLTMDPYVLMGLWATSTSRLKLAPGVTNPLTRNLAVTAGAAVTLQAISGGRAVLGIGRGDSALAYLGHRPVATSRFETAVTHLQTLLSGGEVSFEDFGVSGDAGSVHDLSLGERPSGVKLAWLPEGLPKVPLDVAATGPRVIAAGARMAERLTFSVGAQPERMEWALGTARAARQGLGMGDAGISYGAQLLVICNNDTDKALDTAMRVAPPLVRFQVMDGASAGPRDEEAQRNLDAVHSGYDMNSHADMTATDRIKGGGLSPEFIRRFAIVGNPDQVTRRLLELLAMGLDRFVVVGPRLNLPGWSEEEDSLFAREVIPALKT